jgi:peptide/nickel transport system permease protein
MVEKQMRKYIIKRILSLIPVLFVVSIVIFLLIHLTPGDPAAMMLGEQATDASIAQLRQTLGLNEPLPVQYIHWVGNIFNGNLGVSLFIHQPMIKILGDHLLPTLQLTTYAEIFAVLFAIPLGILAAKNRGLIADQAISMVSIVGISLPSFLLGLILILVFAVALRLLPVAGYKSIAQYGWGQHLRFMILPSIALGFIEAALMIRMTRSSMLEILGSDYIRMAKAKGVSTFVVFMKHALRNALIPIVTVVGLSFMVLLGGAAVTESIFNIPGIGKLTIDSVLRRDYEVIQAVVLLVSVTNVVITLIIDLLYGLIDPRVRIVG